MPLISAFTAPEELQVSFVDWPQLSVVGLAEKSALTGGTASQVWNSPPWKR